VAVLRGRGNGTFVRQQPTLRLPDSDLIGLAVADVNNDGKLDIVFIDSRTDAVGIILQR